jgi:putative endonuclease
MNCYVYILANKYDSALYTGFTSDLRKRMYQHKHKYVDGFLKRFNVTKLVYFEQHRGIDSARLRERQIKKWNRAWKIKIIEKDNPEWEDLYKEIIK